jgi:anti-sigma factor RsiW
MPDCNATRQRLQDYLDGQLSDAACRDMEAHLAQCPDCRAEVQAWRHLFAALDEPELPGPPPGFAPAVLRRVAQARVRRRRLQTFVAAAAVVLACGGAVLWALPDLPAAASSHARHLAEPAPWAAAADAFTQFAAGTSAAAEAALAHLPGAAILAGALAALMALNAALAYRWRSLAYAPHAPNTGGQS